MFNKILIANRGEIAVRVIRSAKDLGFRTVAVYSNADAEAPHVLMADEAVLLGNSAAIESYLSIEKILHAAAITGADAIHPGYGFLSENAEFALQCEQKNITFIGPSASAIKLMGSKRQAKIAMLNAGVPCIPGYEGDNQSDDILVKKAIEIGFPVMIKSSAGGGGRGMRLVHQENELHSAIKSARSESLNAFGCDELIIEKALSNARHIEIQIFADKFGHTIHLGERDCSVQRRHQKVIEESPSLAISPTMRNEMGTAAILAAKACDYVGAGTVEFLFDDAEQRFYFLEMNTRLQVEHPVTELVTGLDLVALQLNVANGEMLPLSQEEVTIKGHAIEVRLYAEDPASNFMPQTGNILAWKPALTDPLTLESIKGVRVDSGIKEGQSISAFYDPMLAKFIAYGDNREQARRRLLRLVQDSKLLGLRDNRAFLCELLTEQVFIDGKATTNFIAENFTNKASTSKQITTPEELAIIAILMKSNMNEKNHHATSTFHSSYLGEQSISIGHGNQLPSEKPTNLQVTQLSANNYVVSNLEKAWHQTIEILSLSSNELNYLHLGVRKNCSFIFDPQAEMPLLWLSSDRGNIQCIDQSLIVDKAEKSFSDQVLASMGGVVIDLLVAEGDAVSAGDTVAIIEAMKMEHLVKAGIDGMVSELLVNIGEQVKARQLLAQLK